jgi:hypothetical protein
MRDCAVKEWLPIAVSVLSFIVAGIALGWNIYRDVILKARVKVSFGVYRILSRGQRVGDGEQVIKISATNHGPGPVRLELIVGKRSSLWRRVRRRVEHFFVLNDDTNPLNPKLPNKIEVGDTLTLLLPYDEKSVLAGTATHIGLSDSYGRSHFASRRDLSEAKKQFDKDFPNVVRRPVV